MRVILDANIPRKLERAITGHDVSTARELGLNALPDDKLLDAIEANFDVLITMDQSLRYQQHLRPRSISVLVLGAKSNRLADLLPLVAEVLRVLPFLRAGEVRTIDDRN